MPKGGYIGKKLRIERQDLFSSNTRNWTGTIETILHLSNKQSSSKVFRCIATFSPEIDKKTAFQSKKRLSLKEVRNYPGRTFFSNDCETGPLQSIVSTSKQPHWTVQFYSGVLYIFHWKSPKTTIL